MAAEKTIEHRVWVKGWKKHLHRVERSRVFAQKKHRRKFLSDADIYTPDARVALSRILRFLSKVNKVNPKISSGKRKRNFRYNLPNKFCFIEYPDESLQAIKFIMDSMLYGDYKFIKLSHAKVVKYNLTSEVLLAIAADKSLQYRRLANKKLRINGSFPKDKAHEQLVSEIGIVKEINGERNSALPLSKDRQHLFSRHSINIAKANAFSDDDKTKATESFVKYLKECMNDYDLEFPDKTYRKLFDILSEVLCNAERHSSDDNDHVWYVRGYLNGHSDVKNFEICLFNFGNTIADTFSNAPDSNFSKAYVQDYVDCHKSQFTEEQLITIAALQHRVSSKNLTSRDTDGQGTVELIEFFEILHEEYQERCDVVCEAPMMSIVSGKTHIVFDGTYKLHNIATCTEEEEQYIISFNEDNDLAVKPDRKYIRSLDKTYFPGVAISIRFPLSN